MGYGMNQLDASFCIKSKDFASVLKVIQELYNHYNDSLESHRKCFVKSTLVEEFKEWEWVAETNEDGDIDSITFDGSRLGSEDELFKAIAPYVTPGSHIDMIGDDFYIWQWYFDGNTAIRYQGDIVFPESPHEPGYLAFNKPSTEEEDINENQSTAAL